MKHLQSKFKKSQDLHEESSKSLKSELKKSQKLQEDSNKELKKYQALHEDSSRQIQDLRENVADLILHLKEDKKNSENLKKNK